MTSASAGEASAAGEQVQAAGADLEQGYTLRIFEVNRELDRVARVAEDATPDAEERRRFDKSRTNKRVSNDEWVSETDPDARIAKMKDGRTHLAYKAEHVVDLDTENPENLRLYGKLQEQLKADIRSASFVTAITVQ